MEVLAGINQQLGADMIASVLAAGLFYLFIYFVHGRKKK